MRITCAPGSCRYARSRASANAVAHAERTGRRPAVRRRRERQNVSRVRAVVARPDLSADESAAAMAHALVADDRERRTHRVSCASWSSALARRRRVASLPRRHARSPRARGRDVRSRRRRSTHRTMSNGGALSHLRILERRSRTPARPRLRVHDASSGIDEATYETCARRSASTSSATRRAPAGLAAVTHCIANSRAGDARGVRHGRGLADARHRRRRSRRPRPGATTAAPRARRLHARLGKEPRRRSPAADGARAALSRERARRRRGDLLRRRASGPARARGPCSASESDLDATARA